jgi:serine/threonine protein kinase
MGEVYKARDTRLDRTVAIKVLPAHLAANVEARTRFEREARAVSAHNHPNICTLHDVGREGGVDFLVMEHLEGETLLKRLESGPLPVAEILKIAVPLARALDAAHREGVLHRDLKPGNVILTRSGPKLLDFGLAKGLEAQVASDLSASPTLASPLTAEGAIVGTFQYMAPEQIEGKEADVRTDLWAFGAILYEMATGLRAFEGKTQASLIASILKEEPRPIPEVMPMAPPALERVVRRCLAKDPDDRWQTARDLAAELEWIASGGSQAGIAAPDVATPAGRPWPIPAMAATAVVAVVVFAAGWFLGRPSGAPPQIVRSSIVLPAGTILDTDNKSITLSPDGMVLAYSGREPGGRMRLWVRRLDSVDPQPLAGTEGASYPFWSPDGRYLGFFAGGKLRKIPSTGGTAQTICDAADGRGASWGADGVIVFAPRPFGPLLQVAAAGGAASPITTEERVDYSHRNPYFLPDGKRLLFFLGGPTDRPDNGIFSLDVASGETALVLNSESEGIFVEPGYLAFVREGNLMAQPIDRDSLKLTGEAIPLVENVQFNTFRYTGTYTFSPNGMMLFRSGAIQADSQLTWFDLDGNRLGTVGDPAIFWLNLALAPDGRRVVTTIRHVDGKSDLWIYDLERGLGSRFTFGDLPALNPLWSPDGREVSFIDGGGSIYAKAADGTGEPRALISATSTIGVIWDWHPDGSRLLTMSQSAELQTDLVLLSPGDDPPLSPVQSTPAEETWGKFSPDGKWLAFLSNESGRNEAYIVAFPGPGGKWQLSATGAVNVRWLPDGNSLLYESPEGKIVQVLITIQGANIAIGAARELFGGRAADIAGVPWTLAPDGKRILAALPLASNIAPTLTLVTNWAAGIEPR